MISNRLAAISASVVILGALLVGLYILGSPTEERNRRLDEQRIADLLLLSRAVNANYAISENLPADLESIQDGARLSRIPRDPEKNIPYGYERVTADSYRLCAEFSRESDEARVDDFWAHAEGRQCFSFNAHSVD